MRTRSVAEGLVRLGAALVSFLALVACGDAADVAPPPERAAAEAAAEPEAAEAEVDLEPWTDAWLMREGERYLGDAPFRRASMLAALRNHENLYSRIRVASYGLEDRGWDRLPAWNPRSRTLTAADHRALLAGETLAELGEAPIWDGEPPDSMAAWVRLGREVFYRFPLRADRWVEHGLRTPGYAARFGLEVAADGTLPGAVYFRDVDGRQRVGISCAVCHTTESGGVTIEGRARRGFDYGALQLAYAHDRGATIAPEMAARMASWGPGRADITEDDDEDPVAIPDLWGLRHQSALTQAGTIRHIGPVALALRQETQYLYANHHRVRPERVLMWALTMYLYALEPPARPADDGETGDAEVVARGREVFVDDGECSECHDNAAYGGDTVRATRIGTDLGLSRGVARGTGLYRPSGLIRVADAAPYLHHGAVDSLESLLSRDRLGAAYEGPLGAGAVPGHAYGLDLSPGDKRALLAFLRTL